jgi:hypothetical protein
MMFATAAATFLSRSVWVALAPRTNACIKRLFLITTEGLGGRVGIEHDMRGIARL